MGCIVSGCGILLIGWCIAPLIWVKSGLNGSFCGYSCGCGSESVVGFYIDDCLLHCSYFKKIL